MQKRRGIFIIKSLSTSSSLLFGVRFSYLAFLDRSGNNLKKENMLDIPDSVILCALFCFATGDFYFGSPLFVQSFLQYCACCFLLLIFALISIHQKITWALEWSSKFTVLLLVLIYLSNRSSTFFFYLGAVLFPILVSVVAVKKEKSFDLLPQFVIPQIFKSELDTDSMLRFKRYRGLQRKFATRDEVDWSGCRHDVETVRKALDPNLLNCKDFKANIFRWFLEPVSVIQAII